MILAPPAFQHPPDFGNGLRRVGTVMQHAPGIHPVERFIGKVQVFRVAHRQVRSQAESRQSAPGMLDGALGQVNAPQIGAGLGELLMIRPQSHANFQHPQSPRFLEPAKIPDIGFEGITCLGLRGVARLFGIGQIEVFATSGLIPKVVDSFLGVIHEVAPATG